MPSEDFLLNPEPEDLGPGARYLAAEMRYGFSTLDTKIDSTDEKVAGISSKVEKQNNRIGKSEGQLMLLKGMGLLAVIALPTITALIFKAFAVE